jgi:hypothetical protein
LDFDAPKWHVKPIFAVSHVNKEMTGVINAAKEIYSNKLHFELTKASATCSVIAIVSSAQMRVAKESVGSLHSSKLAKMMSAKAPGECVPRILGCSFSLQQEDD